jgi:hypothetical protein
LRFDAGDAARDRDGQDAPAAIGCGNAIAYEIDRVERAAGDWSAVVFSLDALEGRRRARAARAAEASLEATATVAHPR